VRAENASLNGKAKLPSLPHLQHPLQDRPPDSESASPGAGKDHGTQNNDQLAGLIYAENKSAAENKQARACENARHCSSRAPEMVDGLKNYARRHAAVNFTAARNRNPRHDRNGEVSNAAGSVNVSQHQEHSPRLASNIPNVGEGATKDVGKNVGAQTSAFSIASVEDDDDTGDFEWTNVEDIVVPSQPAIAVYHNPRGEIVIRQEGLFGYDEDHWIYIRPENLRFLIRRLEEIENGSRPF
jgi:hypothetical protein